MGLSEQDMARVAEIEARYAATTPGTWNYDGMHPEIQNFGDGPFWLLCSELRQHPGDQLVKDEYGHGFNPNFEFMAEAHQDIPWLVALIRRLSEQPEVLRAEWIHGQHDNGKTYCYCSECSEDALYDSSGYRAFSDRCPHCGAQMNGKEVKHG